MGDVWGMHKHHIVFRSQGGLDFALNLIELSMEEHEGDKGPHRNRKRDLELKMMLQEKLFELFPEDEFFNIEQISEELGRTSRYFGKHFKAVPMVGGLYPGREIVKRLMGGKFY